MSSSWSYMEGTSWTRGAVTRALSKGTSTPSRQCLTPWWGSITPLLSDTSPSGWSLAQPSAPKPFRWCPGVLMLLCHSEKRTKSHSCSCFFSLHPGNVLHWELWPCFENAFINILVRHSISISYLAAVNTVIMQQEFWDWFILINPINTKALIPCLRAVLSM